MILTLLLYRKLFQQRWLPPLWFGGWSLLSHISIRVFYWSTAAAWQRWVAEGGAGAVERQRGGVCSGVKRVCSSVCGSVQSVRGGGVRVRLQWRRRVLKDDHRSRLPLSLSVGMTPWRWIGELLQPWLRPRFKAGAGQPLPSGRGRRREEGGRRPGVKEEERRGGGGGGRRRWSCLRRRRDEAVCQWGAPWKPTLIDQSGDPVVLRCTCCGNHGDVKRKVQGNTLIVVIRD